MCFLRGQKKKQSNWNLISLQLNHEMKLNFGEYSGSARLPLSILKGGEIAVLAAQGNHSNRELGYKGQYVNKSKVVLKGVRAANIPSGTRSREGLYLLCLFFFSSLTVCARWNMEKLQTAGAALQGGERGQPAPCFRAFLPSFLVLKVKLVITSSNFFLFFKWNNIYLFTFICTYMRLYPGG